MKAFSHYSEMVKFTFVCIVIAGVAACGGGSYSELTDDDPELMIEPREEDHSDTPEEAHGHYSGHGGRTVH